MNRTNILIPVVSLVIGLSLIGVILFQQLEVSKLQGRYEESLNSNLQKEREITNLNNNYNQLNLSYSETLITLRQVTDLLNSSDLKLSILQQNYSNLLTSYSNLSTKVQALQNSIAQLSQEFGGYEGIFILNYTYIYTYDYPIHRYFGEFVLYNALESANVTVKVFSPQSYRTFTYSMPANSKQAYVEHWDTGMEMGKDFSLIRIESVERE